jgi:LacI family transcriptional regulator
MVKKDTVGIKEIAKLAGVSIGTVDRVLHNRGGVSQATKEKVLKIVQEAGYKKNIIASRLKLAAKKKFRVAILIPEIKDDFSYWKLPQKGIQRAVEELKEQGISIEYFYFNFMFPLTFDEKREIIIAEKFDAIITVPFLEKECNTLLFEAKKHQIPVVFLDTERMLNQPANFIRQNSYNAGQVAARLLNGLVGEDGVYLVVNILNPLGIQINNQQRERGFRDFFENNFKEKNIEIHTVNHPLDGQLEIDIKTLRFLKEEKKKGIFVTNARSFLLPKILEEYNISNTHIVGFDLNQSNLEYLKSGEISFLINQKPEYQGYSAIKGLYKFLTEKNNEDLNINIPVEIIVKENAL